MKTIITTIISISLLLTYGCSTEKHNDEQSQSEVAHATDADAAPSVQLDNGNKWIANMETTQGIETMIRVVEEESTDQNVEPLKEKLLLEFTNILTKCTMKGESHEQLHNYLLPLKADIEKLSEAPSKEELEAIKAYLLTYNNYFE
jgi:hypothetical protein